MIGILEIGILFSDRFLDKYRKLSQEKLLEKSRRLSFFPSRHLLVLKLAIETPGQYAKFIQS